MDYVTNLPTAKPLYTKRLSDDQELFVTSSYIEKGKAAGVNTVTTEGERIILRDGEYMLFRKVKEDE
jgi:hypothetical protein